MLSKLAFCPAGVQLNERMEKDKSTVEIRLKGRMEKDKSGGQKKGEEARADVQGDISSSEATMVEKVGEKNTKDLLVQIPPDFLCPLSLKLMSDPVIVATGQTYERAYIQQWLDKGNTTCPKTGRRLTHTNLIPSYTVKALIGNWCEAHDIPLLESGKKTTDTLKSTLSRPLSLTSKRNVEAEEDIAISSPPPTRPVHESVVGTQNHPRERSVSNTGSRHTPSKSKRTFQLVKSFSARESERAELFRGAREVDHGLFRGGREDHGENTFPSISRRTVFRSPGGDKNLGRMSALKEKCEAERARNSNPASSPRNPHHHHRPTGSSSSEASSSVEDGQRPSFRVEESSDQISLGSSSPNLSDVSGQMENLSIPSAAAMACNEEAGSPARPESRMAAPFWRRHGEEKEMSSPGNMQPSPAQENQGADGIGQHKVDGLVLDLESCDVDVHREAAAELRLLAKHNMENRIIIANSGAIKPLVALLKSSDPKTQENAVTALLNLSIYDKNKSAIAAAGAINPLVDVLTVGSEQAMENAAATLFILSVMDVNKVTIGASGAIPPLVHLLINGSPRGKKDAATALFNLSISHENTSRIVRAGAIKPLVDLVADPAAGMVDKAVSVLANLATIPEGRAAIGDEGGIPALVEVVEAGSKRGKENAAAALLQLCVHSNKHRALVLQEGAIPPLVALSQSGTARAKDKSSALLRYFREQRLGRSATC